MNISNDDLRHFVSIASTVWSVWTILSTSMSQIDYTLIMFLITNFVTIVGFPLKKEYDTKFWRGYANFVKVITFSLILFFFIDSASASRLIVKNIPHKIIYAFLMGLIGVSYLVFQSKCISIDTLINITEKLSKDIVNQFKETTIAVKDWIEENGGINNVMKNDPEAARIINSAADIAKKITPQDHKKRSSKHKKRRR